MNVIERKIEIENCISDLIYGIKYLNNDSSLDDIINKIDEIDSKFEELHTIFTMITDRIGKLESIIESIANYLLLINNEGIKNEVSELQNTINKT